MGLDADRRNQRKAKRLIGPQRRGLQHSVAAGAVAQKHHWVAAGATDAVHSGPHALRHLLVIGLAAVEEHWRRPVPGKVESHAAQQPTPTERGHERIKVLEASGHAVHEHHQRERALVGQRRSASAAATARRAARTASRDPSPGRRRPRFGCARASAAASPSRLSVPVTYSHWPLPYVPSVSRNVFTLHIARSGNDSQQCQHSHNVARKLTHNYAKTSPRPSQPHGPIGTCGKISFSVLQSLEANSLFLSFDFVRVTRGLAFSSTSRRSLLSAWALTYHRTAGTTR
eukprot:1716410-Prymnesium_polylepis.1